MKSNTGQLCCAFLITIISLVQNTIAQVEPYDSTAPLLKSPARDSLRAPLVPIPYVGSIERNPTQLITDTSINFLDYTYAGDLFRQTPGIFIRDLGSPGQFHGISINGLDARNIAFMSDGVLLNEPFTGLFDPNLYPTENIERVEIITGPRAFLYGLNSTGMAVNFVSRSKKAIHPYTRIRYQEAPYGHGLIDGMFSQDIVRGLNLTAGAQHATYGGRFANSDEDNWNARAKFRYNISNKLNLFASGMYNKTQLGLNGGIDLAKTSDSTRFDRLQAKVVNSDSYEKLTRYDTQIGAAATFFSDTTAVTTLTLFHSTNFREYRDEENRPSPNGLYIKEDTRSQWYGGKLTQRFQLEAHSFEVGTEFSSRKVIASDVVGQNRQSDLSITGKWEYRHPTRVWESALYGRFEKLEAEKEWSIGGDFSIQLLDWMRVFGGLSSSYRFRSILETEAFMAIPTIQFLSGPTERHQQVESGLRLGSTASRSLVVKFGYRYVATRYGFQVLVNPLPRGRDFSHRSISFEGTYKVGSLITEGIVNYTSIRLDNAVDFAGLSPIGFLSSIPRWNFTTGIYYWDKLFADHLDLKTGFRMIAFTNADAINYNSRYQLFTLSTDPASTMSNDPEIPGAAQIDFLLIAHLGNAYVHFVLENLLDKKYVVTSFYPMNERQLRFGVSWEFSD